MTKTILFCFPYAGGSAVIFNSWRKYLAPSIEIRPVELRGRGRRISEKMYDDTTEMIDDVFHVIKNTAGQSTYALFGHSLGALIAYELAQRIRKEQLPPAKHLFFSGRGAPHIKRNDEKIYHLMGEDEFEEEVLKLGGTPPEFFKNPELVDLFLPMLKNDFRLAETGIDTEIIDPLDENITVFLGTEDDLTAEQCEEWKKHSNGACHIKYFEGGHFFLHENVPQIVNIICTHLNNL
jgi:medium-chain acyl-[acyl-carrier-protein] hydrolase